MIFEFHSQLIKNWRFGIVGRVGSHPKASVFDELGNPERYYLTSWDWGLVHTYTGIFNNAFFSYNGMKTQTQAVK